MDRSWEVCDAPGIEGKSGRSLSCAKSRPRDRVLLDFGLAPASPEPSSTRAKKNPSACLLLARRRLLTAPPPAIAAPQCVVTALASPWPDGRRAWLAGGGACNATWTGRRRQRLQHACVLRLAGRRAPSTHICAHCSRHSRTCKTTGPLFCTRSSGCVLRVQLRRVQLCPHSPC